MQKTMDHYAMRFTGPRRPELAGRLARLRGAGRRAAGLPPSAAGTCKLGSRRLLAAVFFFVAMGKSFMLVQRELGGGHRPGPVIGQGELTHC